MGNFARIFLAMFVLAAAAIFLVVWIEDKPKEPHFVVEKASIYAADNHHTSALSLHVSAYNPNAHYWIYYDVVMVSVYDGNDTLLAYKVLPNPFSHQPMTQLSLNVGPVAHNVSVTLDGSLEVRVRAAARFKIKAWKKFHGTLKAICSPVAAMFNSSDAGRDQPILCYVLDF